MRITLKGLTKSYRDGSLDREPREQRGAERMRELEVLSAVNFEFPERRAIAIVGRSGIGKSTLLHLIGGLDTPSAGSVLYGERDLYAMSDDQRTVFRGECVGFIFQFHHLLPEFTALENAAMPLLIRGVPEDEACDRAGEILRRVGLSHRVRHLPGELSGGEQQRVAIARALVSQPAVLLADEPTGNLDVKTSIEVKSLLLELNRESGAMMIVVTHQSDLAASMDLVLEMQPGGELRALHEGAFQG